MRSAGTPPVDSLDDEHARCRRIAARGATGCDRPYRSEVELGGSHQRIAVRRVGDAEGAGARGKQWVGRDQAEGACDRRRAGIGGELEPVLPGERIRRQRYSGRVGDPGAWLGPRTAGTVMATEDKQRPEAQPYTHLTLPIARIGNRRMSSGRATEGRRGPARRLLPGSW